MGGGSWTTKSYADYAKATCRTTSMTSSGTIVLNTSYTAQDIFKERHIHKSLEPMKVMRECCDTEEHPNTIPVILALDVTGSMGQASANVAIKLNEIMEELYKKVRDVEFMIMAIGDLAYDYAPIQISQFESDIRIAEHLDKVFFEHGGGGNKYESYTAAWYMGLYHTKLDCWKRGKKGIIITMGDETLNPYLPQKELALTTGDALQGDIETPDLYQDVVKKFDVYHLAIDDKYTSYNVFKDGIASSFGEYLDSDHLRVVNLDNISNEIIDIVSGCSNITESINEISW